MERVINGEYLNELFEMVSVGRLLTKKGIKERYDKGLKKTKTYGQIPLTR